MTDRELLEMAAKAAGLKIWRWLASDTPQLECTTHQLGPVWNPLTDDGDALRLFTKLSFCELYVSDIGATVSWRTYDGGGKCFKCDEYASKRTGDLSAATRRAIVRAAAEIGKAMP